MCVLCYGRCTASSNTSRTQIHPLDVDTFSMLSVRWTFFLFFLSSPLQPMGLNVAIRFVVTKGGSYGNKILYKNLKFFDKIFVPSKIS